jgi:hypothetical protein
MFVFLVLYNVLVAGLLAGVIISVVGDIRDRRSIRRLFAPTLSAHETEEARCLQNVKCRCEYSIDDVAEVSCQQDLFSSTVVIHLKGGMTCQVRDVSTQRAAEFEAAFNALRRQL